MLLRDFSYFAVLTVSIIASTTAVAERNETKVSDEKENRKLNKRETILLDGPSETSYLHRSPTKVVYRKASRSRYGKPKSKYGKPKSKYGPPKISRPKKKYARKPVAKYAPRATYKKPKPRHAPPQLAKTKVKTYYAPVKTFEEETYNYPEPTGFGEPQISFPQPPNIPKTYGEVPFDSYSIPLTNTYHQYPTEEELLHDQTQQNYYSAADHPFSPSASTPTHWQSDYTQSQPYSYDNNYADSQTQQTNGAAPLEDGVPDDEVTHDFVEQTELLSPKPTAATFPRRNLKRRKPYTPRNKGSQTQYGDKQIVGGKYAEPPARYVSKFQSSAPTYSNNGFSYVNNYMDSEMAGTAGSAVSSYVNYKNSNLAFSPQNLNDVFSIVD